MRSRRADKKGFREPIDPYAIDDLNETGAGDARFYDRTDDNISPNSYQAENSGGNTSETFGWNAMGGCDNNQYTQNDTVGNFRSKDETGSMNRQQYYNAANRSYSRDRQYSGENPSFDQYGQPYSGENPSFDQNGQSYNGQNPSFDQNEQPYGSQNSFFNPNQQSYSDRNQASDRNQWSQSGRYQSYDQSNPYYNNQDRSFDQKQQYYNDQDRGFRAQNQSYTYAGQAPDSRQSDTGENQLHGSRQSGTGKNQAHDGRQSRTRENQIYGRHSAQRTSGNLQQGAGRSPSRASGRKAENRNSDKRAYRDSTRRRKAEGSTSRRGDGRRFHPVLLIVLLIFVMAGVFGLHLYQKKYSYSNEQADVNSYFQITDNSDVPIVWNNALSDIHAKLIDGTVYMDISSVKSNLNDRFYYGRQNSTDENGIVLYSLPTQTVKTVVGSSDVETSDGTQTMDYKPAVRDGDTIYLALAFVQQYTNFNMQQFDSPTRLVITTDYSDITTAAVNRNTAIRTSGGIKSPVLENLSEGDTVTVLEQMDTWSHVVSADGFIGYIENKRLDNLTQTKQTPASNYTEPEYTTHQLGEKVNMAFHNVYSTEAANDTLQSYMAKTQAVNVIAPTIFWVKDEQGDISSFASQYYVDTAHNMGLKVWAVVDNINSTDLGDKSSFLATEDARQNLISQLMNQVQTYGYDGINVDFELIEEQYGDDYIQFIRELSIACRNAGLTLSVDGYPNYEFNSYYHLKEQGIFVDYCVVMGYDEHYAGSTEAGSVASINYVTEGIKMACEKVDPSKIINAVPFYSRIWTTSADGSVTSEAYGLQDIQDYISSHGMTQTWSAADGQNYAEMTDDSGNKIQIWVEDEQSIKLKLDAMTASGIAGVAEWKLDFDTEAIWSVIADYMKQ